MGTIKPPPKGLNKETLHRWFDESAAYDEDAPASGRYHVGDPYTSSRCLFSDDTKELWTRFCDLYFGKTFYYWSSCDRFMPKCTERHPNALDHLSAMIDAERRISYDTLARHCVQLGWWEELMGYDVGLKLKNDFMVSYHKSLYDGQVAYYIAHSSIEHIWLPREYVECHRKTTQIASPVGDVRTAEIRPVSRLT